MICWTMSKPWSPATMSMPSSLLLPRRAQEHISLVAAAGKPIFSEKPLAVDVADGRICRGSSPGRGHSVPDRVSAAISTASYARAHELDRRRGNW